MRQIYVELQRLLSFVREQISSLNGEGQILGDIVIMV